MTESVYLIFNILSFRLDYIQGQRTKVVLSGGTLRWGKVLMGARFVGKIFVFQTAQHANCDSEYNIYHIRDLYKQLDGYSLYESPMYGRSGQKPRIRTLSRSRQPSWGPRAAIFDYAGGSTFLKEAVFGSKKSI